MKRFALLLVIIIVTALAFWPITSTPMGDGQVTATQVLGIPVLGAGTGQFCWLSIGMGQGVLFVGILGAGVVSIALAVGGGLLFGIGQATCGLIAVGQLAIGVVCTLAQLGTGATGAGQLIVGLLVKGQVELGKDGGSFLRQLREDLNEVLAFR
jgi:hypothetical protein